MAAYEHQGSDHRRCPMVEYIWHFEKGFQTDRVVWDEGEYENDEAVAVVVDDVDDVDVPGGTAAQMGRRRGHSKLDCGTNQVPG